MKRFVVGRSPVFWVVTGLLLLAVVWAVAWFVGTYVVSCYVVIDSPSSLQPFYEGRACTP